nr:LlaJI family restriction endonuclease [uncultured Mediterraneibacter sp.]
MQYRIKKMQEETELTGRDFVGVLEGINGDLEVSVPYGVVIESCVKRSDADSMRLLKTYVKSIQRALNSSNVKNDIDDNSAGMKHPLAAVSIICDYITMGLLFDYEEEKKLTNTGKMDFGTTFKKVVPKYVNGNFIYDEYYTRRKHIVTDNYVAVVQGNIINHFMQHGGEILFGSKLSVEIRPIKLDKTVINKLRRELLQTNNSRRQNIIRLMIEYIKGMTIENSSSKDGKWDYAIIASTLWENMILSVYGNQYPVNKAKYGKRYSFQSLATGSSVMVGRPTEHDTLYEDDKQIIIIDAKMYGNPKNLLSEEVLGKQFGYYVEAKKRNPGKRIINILFAPTIKEKSENDGFADIVITDPHVDSTIDPDRIIYLYRCSANKLIFDYYYSRKKYTNLLKEFDDFISLDTVRKFLDDRGASY